MHVAIEASSLTQKWPTGIGHYTYKLLEGLMTISEHEPLNVSRIYEWRRFKHRNRLAHVPAHAQSFWHNKWRKPKQFDLVHVPAFLLPTTRKVAKVVTVHDLYALKGGDIIYPGDIKPQLGYHEKVSRLADRVICVSEHTRQDFLQFFPKFDSSRVHVVHLGVDEQFAPLDHEAAAQVRARFSGGEPYILFMGSIRRNKNIVRLIEAYARSSARHDYKLVIAGEKNQAGMLYELLSRWEIESRVELWDYLDKRDVPALYAAASALAMPSLYEGFGLPILEAMASRTPVLTSTGGSCPEVAGGHALIVDPRSIDDIRRGFDTVVDASPEAIDAAYLYARGKTWGRVAQLTYDVFKQTRQDFVDRARP